jgi:cyclophilin family peptidyl-prolyl cis-trans isomerase
LFKEEIPLEPECMEVVKNLKAEFNHKKHIPGAVAMARAQDPDSADSQFYISLGTHPHLDGKYTLSLVTLRRIRGGTKNYSG